MTTTALLILFYRDLLLTAAMCHDIGKVKEISAFPVNDYTDDGQLLGHIVMGTQMVGERAAKIDGFPHNLFGRITALYSGSSRQTGIRLPPRCLH